MGYLPRFGGGIDVYGFTLASLLSIYHAACARTSSGPSQRFGSARRISVLEHFTIVGWLADCIFSDSIHYFDRILCHSLRHYYPIDLLYSPSSSFRRGRWCERSFSAAASDLWLEIYRVPSSFIFAYVISWFDFTHDGNRSSRFDADGFVLRFTCRAGNYIGDRRFRYVAGGHRDDSVGRTQTSHFWCVWVFPYQRNRCDHRWVAALDNSGRDWTHHRFILFADCTGLYTHHLAASGAFPFAGKGIFHSLHDDPVLCAVRLSCRGAFGGPCFRTFVTCRRTLGIQYWADLRSRVWAGDGFSHVLDRDRYGDDSRCRLFLSTFEVNRIDEHQRIHEGKVGMKKEAIEAIYPLSPVQQGIHFHTLYQPEVNSYIVQATFAFHGDLNVSAFEKAWQHVMNRHPIMRTSFVWEGIREPVQVVHRRVVLSWEKKDWRQLSKVEQEGQLEEFLKADRTRNFDLTKCPLMRVALFQMAEKVYQFVWTLHHIIHDGWSSSLQIKEVCAFYEAFCQGRDLALPAPRPFKDYVVWVKQQSLSSAEAFWRQTLKGFTTPITLNLDAVGEGSPSGEGRFDWEEIRLSESSTSALESYMRKNRITLNTLVQGAWALLMSHYSGEQDVVFGVVLSGRSGGLAGVESMVGPLLNTLPVRVKVPPHQQILPWLQQLQGQLVKLTEYEYSPLVKVQGWSDIPRGQSLFETIVALENFPMDGVFGMGQASGNLEMRDFRSAEGTNYPLTVTAVPGPRLMLNISYDNRRFESTSIARLLGHWQMFLEGMVTDLERHLGDIPIFTKVERHRLLVEWNSTKADYPQDKCIHQLFEAQVEKTPDSIALLFEKKSLSYRELNRKANQLAHYLQKLGIGPDVLVGICMDRSLEMVIGLLGILKAGGAYVPLDPSYPKERLVYVLEDSQVSAKHGLIRLTDRRLASRAVGFGFQYEES